MFINHILSFSLPVIRLFLNPEVIGTIIAYRHRRIGIECRAAHAKGAHASITNNPTSCAFVTLRAPAIRACDHATLFLFAVVTVVSSTFVAGVQVTVHAKKLLAGFTDVFGCKSKIFDKRFLAWGAKFVVWIYAANHDFFIAYQGVTFLA